MMTSVDGVRITRLPKRQVMLSCVVGPSCLPPPFFFCFFVLFFWLLKSLISWTVFRSAHVSGSNDITKEQTIANVA